MGAAPPATDHVPQVKQRPICSGLLFKLGVLTSRQRLRGRKAAEIGGFFPRNPRPTAPVHPGSTRFNGGAAPASPPSPSPARSSARLNRPRPASSRSTSPRGSSTPWAGSRRGNRRSAAKKTAGPIPEPSTGGAPPSRPGPNSLAGPTAGSSAPGEIDIASPLPHRPASPPSSPPSATTASAPTARSARRRDPLPASCRQLPRGRSGRDPPRRPQSGQKTRRHPRPAARPPGPGSRITCPDGVTRCAARNSLPYSLSTSCRPGLRSHPRPQHNARRQRRSLSPVPCPAPCPLRPHRTRSGARADRLARRRRHLRRCGVPPDFDAPCSRGRPPPLPRLGTALLSPRSIARIVQTRAAALRAARIWRPQPEARCAHHRHDLARPRRPARAPRPAQDVRCAGQGSGIRRFARGASVA